MLEYQGVISNYALRDVTAFFAGKGSAEEFTISFAGEGGQGITETFLSKERDKILRALKYT